MRRILQSSGLIAAKTAGTNHFHLAGGENHRGLSDSS
jgi:hypothetical protein